MAKPLGQKSLLIRSAIKANPDLGNKAIAEKLNDSADRLDDKIKVTPNDIAQQKQAMKSDKATAPKAAAPAAAVPAEAPKKRGRPKGKGGRPKKTASAVAPVAAARTSASPVDLIDGVLTVAKQCGGLAALKRLVDRLAEM